MPEAISPGKKLQRPESAEAIQALWSGELTTYQGTHIDVQQARIYELPPQPPDLFVATSPLAAQTIRRYRPYAEVRLVPPPVRAAFYAPPPQPQIRAELGVRPGAACVLLTAGGWGLAPLARYAEALAGAGLEVLAVAGSNDRLARKLETLAATRPN